MSLPRRVPWASSQDLKQLNDLLFAPSADTDSRRRALSRLSIYISSPNCPVFILLTHDLVSASFLPAKSSEERQTARMACGMAVVRFINGLVDPLQTGMMAQPISHLAATLQIPQSLITLRHRCTHEDLPPYPMLLQAVYTAIQYLHQHSFLPLVSAAVNTENVKIRKSQESIQRWKRVMKIRLRERVEGEDNETGKQMREIREDMTCDLEDIAEALCGADGLVPTTQKNRPLMSDQQPTKASLMIWQDLLAYLQWNHWSGFIEVLSKEILYHVIPRKGEKTQDDSFRWSLAVWLLYMWKGSDEMGVKLEEEEKAILTKTLLQSLIIPDTVLRNLCEGITSVDPIFAKSYNNLKDLLPEEETHLVGLEAPEEKTVIPLEKWQQVLEEMEEKLNNLNKNGKARKRKRSTKIKKDEVRGWHRLNHEEWTDCPIAV
ncbi:hypothetical protein TREMEDRAFT_59622 [Tremella mesenterica DSM 1558]|uniref:uncharacterized protein n=1 Tax=Tremella mesenterica (strain ATCC 24925 / CBS 8224 / DSM 1558 / NBRC 9311 / NRRL Y-6157 / RJB 2259-6 / UBC 559-6) TaxID=578456 RepID=UPI0003F490A8|nr:uncharacterized protein TREMEDRAFT_59622 [Tremella mesenterica DSM 1558]EIW73454.1 hypothetical protein TREMEDRAFT_59622 [Tremella mesenterica DSM 1558]